MEVGGPARGPPAQGQVRKGLAILRKGTCASRAWRSRIPLVGVFYGIVECYHAGKNRLLASTSTVLVLVQDMFPSLYE